jgi:imidazolonepropionase-like amidohydrolase
MEFSEHHPLHQQPRRTLAELRADMAGRALRMLCRGITSARDLGGSGNFAALKLRDEISSGHLLGPRLLCAGQPITTVGGHCHQWGGAVGSDDDVRKTIERQVSMGVDWIKVMATGGIRTPGTRPDQAQFSEADLRLVVSLASEHNLPVAAHAHATVGIQSAVAAGCRTVEHCSWTNQTGFCAGVDDATIEDMAKQGVCVAPTAHANWANWPKDGKGYQRMSGALTRLRKAGVPLLASSDAGAIPGLAHDALSGAVEVMGEWSGMRPVEALRSATSRSAQALGLGSECGQLLPGFSADVLAVYGDPLSDLKALRHVRFVVARGHKVNPLEHLNRVSNFQRL